MVAIACLGLRDPDCRLVAAAVVEAYAGVGPIGALSITAHGGCGEPCPPTLAARREGSVLVESGAALTIASWRAATPTAILVERADVMPGISVVPTSVRTGPGAVPYTLGHCGLSSGIDVDGSWWDPVGFIDDEHPAAINSASGSVTFSGDTGVFQTADGFDVSLVRHAGPKSLPGCM